MQLLQKILLNMVKGLNKMTTEIATTNNDLDVNFNIPTGFINTLDLSTNEGKIATVNAMNNSEPLNNHVGEIIEVVDCITIPGIRKGRNGAPDTECVNTHLIDTKGNVYFSQSDGVARSIRSFAALWPDFGKGTTVEGFLPMVCKNIELANGNTLKTMVIVEDYKA